MANILAISFQSAGLLLAIWIAFRLVPSVPPEWKVWIWRLAFLKPVLALLPMLTVPVRVLPPSPTAVSEISYSLSESAVPTTQAGTIARPMVAAPSPTPQLNPFALFWILGSGACLVLTFQKWHRAQQLLRLSEPISDPQIRHYSRDLCSRARVEEEPELMSSDLVHTAMLVASRKPTIVLPESALDAERKEDARMMLAHELAHVARRDLAWLTAISLVQAVFFFNPMVWLAGRTCRLDHESATDRLAARLAGVSLPEYAGMLLRTSVVQRATLSVAALPATESYRSVQHRLKAMTHFTNKPTRGRRFAAIAIALGTIGLVPFYQLAEAAPVQAKSQQTKKFTTKADSVMITVTDKADGKDVIYVKPATMVAKPGVKVGQQRTYEVIRRTTKGKKGQDVYIYEVRAPKGVQRVNVVPGQPISVVGKAVRVENLKTVVGQPVTVIASDDVVVGRAVKSVQGHPVTIVTTTGTAIVGKGKPQTIEVHGIAMPAEAVDTTARIVSKAQSGVSTPATRDYVVNVVGSRDGRTISLASAGGRNLDHYGSFAINNVNGEVKIKFEFKNFSLSEAITSLFRATDKKFRFEGNVDRTITASVRDASFEAALDALVRAGNVKVTETDGVYVISQA